MNRFPSLASANATVPAPCHAVYATLLDVSPADWCTFDGVLTPGHLFCEAKLTDFSSVVRLCRPSNSKVPGFDIFASYLEATAARSPPQNETAIGSFTQTFLGAEVTTSTISGRLRDLMVSAGAIKAADPHKAEHIRYSTLSTVYHRAGV